MHPGVGLRRVLVPLGAALEKSGMPQLSSAWGGAGDRGGAEREGSAVTFLGLRERDPGRLVLI